MQRRFKYPRKKDPMAMTRPEKDFDSQCKLLMASQQIHGTTGCVPEILRVDFEKTKLRLGNDWKRTYKPDFRVVWGDDLVSMVEVKQRDKTGRVLAEDDAKEKYKNATENLPEYQWVWASFSKFSKPNWQVKCIPDNKDESERWGFLT